MQNISTVHNCLLFEYNTRKYLYGVTQSLCASQSALRKINIDYIIYPTSPYEKYEQQNIIGIFRWSNQIHKLKYKAIVVQDMKIKEQIIDKCFSNDNKGVVNSQWQSFKQHGIKETELLKLLWNSKDRQRIQARDIGWYNCNKQQLNIIVPQQGTSTYICHQTNVIVLNPSQQWIQWLQKRDLEAYAIIMNMESSITSVIPYILRTKKKVNVVCLQSICTKLIQCCKQYIGIKQNMVYNKLNIRTIHYQQEPQQFPLSVLTLSYIHNQQYYPYIRISYGYKHIHVYQKTLQHYPHELGNPEIQYVICYKIHEQIKKQLYSLPVLHRKKIIMNRIDHKYKHKYFVTFDNNTQFCTVISKAGYKFKNTIPFQFRSSEWSIKVMNNGEQITLSKAIVKVLEGCVKVTKQNESYIVYKGKEIRDAHRLQCIKNAVIAIQSYSVFRNKSICQENYNNKLKRKIIDNFKELDNNKLVKQLSAQEHKILNHISIAKTFEVGYKANYQKDLDICVYFVVKGALKWEDSDSVAKTGSFIGNMKSYYEHKPVNYVIQVLKDSWVVQIPMVLFAKEFLEKYPERLYQIYSYGTVFQ